MRVKLCKLFEEQATNSPPYPTPPFPPTLPPEIALPIALRKGIRSTCNPSPHYVNLGYHRLSHLRYACISSLSSMSIPKTVGDTLSDLGMFYKMCALQNSGTQDFVLFPLGKFVVALQVAGGFSQSTLGSVVKLIASRLVWQPKVIIRIWSHLKPMWDF